MDRGASGHFGYVRVSWLLALTMLAVFTTCALGAPSSAHADSDSGYIGVVQCDGKNLNASSFEEINEELVRLKGKTVTINMFRDWDARDASANGVSVAGHLVIPAGTRVTLNMDGYKIDRGLSGEARDMSKSSGEVIQVQGGAVLTVNGGSTGKAKARTHDTYVYESTEPDGFVVPSLKTFTGGLITGGNNKDGAGGICMLTGSTVTLNDVTVAGCRNRAPTKNQAPTSYNERSGGGGVRMEGGSTTLNMNNSTITGCLANNGGGIYVDAIGKEAVNLQDSHVDANNAKVNGGGIILGALNRKGKEVSVTGDGNSTVSRNKCEESGGGIYVYSTIVSVRGLTLEANSAKWAGGISTRNDSTALHKLVIKNNTASEFGGGAYITAEAASASGSYGGDSVISDCTVQYNSAPKCGGILIGDYGQQRKERKRVISGVTVVSDNEATDGGIANLCIETDEWRYKRESFSLAEGSNVWAGSQPAAGNSISADVKSEVVSDGKCETYLHSEREGLAFHFDLEKRHIDLVSSSDPGTGATNVPVAAANANNASGKDGGGARTDKAGKVGTVAAGGESGSDYDLVRGFYMHDNETDLAAFYYSDGLFYTDPKQYNIHLATLSWTWAYTAGYLNQFKDPSTHQNTSGADASTYYNKHAAARQFLADIGCPDQNIYVNDSMVGKPGTNTIGVAIGSKNLQRYEGSELEETGDILIPVAVRGMGYETEWVSNVTLDTAAQMSPGAEARGFSNAADQVVSEIGYYLKKYSLEDELRDGKVKFWVTGFSRAGATANLTSKRLVDRIEAECTGEGKSQVFAYPCEAPKGGTDLADEGLKNSDDRYFCIHNMINAVDIVPYVAPEQMGFKRYGVDHYIPGGEAGARVKTSKTVSGGGANGPTTVTTYADNEPWKTKTDTYKAQKALMLKQLDALDSDFVFDDYFHPKALDFISVSKFQLMRVYDNGNAGNQVEDFVEDFMRFIQQGPPDKDWGAAASSRDVYAKSVYTLNGKKNPTIQAALGDLVKVFMGASGDGMADFLDKAGNIQNNIPSFGVQFHWFYGSDVDSAFSMSSLYFNVIGNWHKLSDKQKTFWTANLWNAFKKTGALEELSPGDRTKFETSFPTVINLAFNFVDGDYNYKPKDNEKNKFPQWAKGSSESMMYAPTFMEHAGYIISCHMPQLNTAWARSYDSWFTDNGEQDTYGLSTQGYSVAAPKAYRIVNGEQQQLAEGDQPNRLAGNQRIVLENDDIVGEAIYYDLVDLTSGKTLARNQIYRGGIDLSLEGAVGKTFQLKTYDMSYGVPSDVATYNVELFTANHTVIVKDLPSDASAGVLGSAAAGTQAAPLGSGNGNPSLMVGSIADPTALQAQEIDASAYRTRTYSFAEGQEALVQADAPDALFFKEWKVKALTEDGSDVSGMIDYAAQVFQPEDGKRNAAASFTMPQSGTTPFPAGYQLEFTAQYGTRIQAIDTFVSAPVAGSNLAGELEVSFPSGVKKSYPIAWAYKYGDKVVPVHVEADDEQHSAYKNTEYLATIVVPQDAQNDIAFTSSVDVSSSVEAQGTIATESKTAQRNDDGSIAVQLAFPATGSAGGDEPPEAQLQFAVQAVDLNTGLSIAGKVSYSVQPSKLITITAPEIEDEQFAGWDLGSTGIRTKYADPEILKEKIISLRMPEQLGEGAEGAVVTAQYVPVVNEVAVNLYDKDGGLYEPTGNADQFARAEVLIKITDEYEISPDNLQVTWMPALPAGGEFAYLTDYVATVAITPDLEGKVLAKKSGESEYTPINLQFVAADDVKATFNGSDEDVSLDAENREVSKVFPKMLYTLDAVKQPANIEGVPYGTSEEGMRALLPKTTKVFATNGFEADADIEWGTIADSSGADEGFEPKVWLANGTVTLPSGFLKPESVSLDVSLTVTVDPAETDEMETALSPSASLDSGTFLYDQITTLATREPGGTTYFTTDGSDPADESNVNRLVYTEGAEIYIPRWYAEVEETTGETTGETTDETIGKKTFTLQAYTVADGKRPSPVAVYSYVFDDLPVPQATDYAFDSSEHIGVPAGAYYTLVAEEGSDARIDGYGNAVATLPGTYRITAVLDGVDDWWKLESDAAAEEGAGEPTVDGGASRTQENQVIEFTISGETPPEEQQPDPTPTPTPTPTPAPADRAEQMGADGTAFGPGASAEAAEAAIAAMTSDEDPAGTAFSKLRLKSAKQTKSSVKLAWAKVKGAKKYILYGNRCGKKYKMKKIGAFTGKAKTVKKVAGKKIKKGTYYKFIVVALDKSNNIVSTSKLIHVATKGGKVTNPKKVNVKKGKKTVSKVVVRKGKAVTVKSVVAKASKKLELKTHRKVKYESSNKKIATVTSKGKIKGVKKGTCYVYAYAQNGVAKKLKVTVK